MRHEIVIGKILKHSGGHGFKLTFENNIIATRMKDKIFKYFQEQGYDVRTDDGGYYDCNERVKRQ